MAVNHVRDTIFCPHSSHVPFLFSATRLLNSLLLFLSPPSLRYKITYSSNPNFLRYQQFFGIISDSIFYKILFTKAVHHVRDTILCPHSDHLSFLFSATSCLIPCYSFFLSPSLRYKVTYNSNHNFLYYQLFLKNYFQFYPPQPSNSIHKQNYDGRRKIIQMDKYFLILFLFHAFFRFLFLSWR